MKIESLKQITKGQLVSLAGGTVALVLSGFRDETRHRAFSAPYQFLACDILWGEKTGTLLIRIDDDPRNQIATFNVGDRSFACHISRLQAIE